MSQRILIAPFIALVRSIQRAQTARMSFIQIKSNLSSNGKSKQMTCHIQSVFLIAYTFTNNLHATEGILRIGKLEFHGMSLCPNTQTRHILNYLHRYLVKGLNFKRASTQSQLSYQ